ncbi:MAG: acetate/propionate family kinase [Candidatus Staskawiczbacteria bacterium]|nr:acetate/propionate family kinase [Candidatus Staskawiczbacteria bacterium]
MILVLNCGSQSIKWKVFDQKLKVVKEGKCAVSNQEKFQESLQEELKKIDGIKIDIIGHRVVHGKDLFKEPIKITDENIKQLETLNNLAPLHNPFNVLGIKTCQKIFPNIPQIAIFDTEFFKDLPEIAYTYALPAEIVKEFGFRKYGFHGISHEYVAKKAAKIVKKPFNKLKIITCHLGGGSSITAIKNGKAIDTSMGFTPMQGLVMMTRAGDMDFGIVLELVREFGLDKTNEILNKESGVKGICGESEMLEVLKKIKSADPEQRRRAKLALDIFVYSIKKYIGSYFAILGGCDLLVFTGSIGSGNKITREMVCKNSDILKKTKVLAIETDEELAIAEKVIKVIK